MWKFYLKSINQNNNNIYFFNTNVFGNKVLTKYIIIYHFETPIHEPSPRVSETKYYSLRKYCLDKMAFLHYF